MFYHLLVKLEVLILISNKLLYLQHLMIVVEALLLQLLMVLVLQLHKL